MVMRARRFFTPTTFLRALEGHPQCLQLYGFVTVLLASSRHERDLYGESLIVDATRSELARGCRVSPKTVARLEDELVRCGCAKLLVSRRNRRVLELIEPDVDAVVLANRAVDNSVGNLPSEADLGKTRKDTGVQLSRTPVSTWDRAVPIPRRESGKGRPARARAGEPAAESRDAKWAPELLAPDEPRLIADGVMIEVRRRLASESTATDRRACTLTRRQDAECLEAVTRRVQALQRGGAGDLAIELTRRDVDRVVEYSLRAGRPAAHLHRSLVRGDWRSDPAPGSQAAAVAERGRSAEMPQERGGRSGAPRIPVKPATAEERAGLERALEAADAPESVRVAARRRTSSAEVVELTQKLGRAALLTAAETDR